jgi:hypothetical protein
LLETFSVRAAAAHGVWSTVAESAQTSVPVPVSGVTTAPLGTEVFDVTVAIENWPVGLAVRNVWHAGTVEVTETNEIVLTRRLVVALLLLPVNVTVLPPSPGRIPANPVAARVIDPLLLPEVAVPAPVPVVMKYANAPAARASTATALEIRMM